MSGCHIGTGRSQLGKFSVATTLDYNLLFKLCLVVARYGEMDGARWWNTNGVLGRIGASAIKRGFPKTHPFVRARIVFAAARERCRELFTHPDCMSLWDLPAAVEDQFDSQWHAWLDAAAEWQPFFDQLEILTSDSLLEILSALKLITPANVQQVALLQQSTAERYLALL